MIATRSMRPLSLDTALAVAVIVVAWAIALVAAVLHGTIPVHHHAILGGHGMPGLGAVLLFLVAWQVMTAGMMLPSSLPLLHLFVRASRGQDHPSLARAAFVVGYFAVWTWFALMALAGDAVLHWLAEQIAPLRERPWLIGGGVLLLAGAFQFSALKERCLRECRSPFSFLQRHYRRGLAPAWDLGVRHGLFCLGCCWALMLTMFAVGVGNLAWMAGLTGVMVIEKTMPWGRRLAPLAGIVLTFWGVLVIANPWWLPEPLALRG
jgi:predicted metal-binding membrane protein